MKEKILPLVFLMYTVFAMSGSISSSNAQENQYVLLEAAANGDIKRVNELLRDLSVNVNTQDKEGNTALILAIEKGYKKIVAALLQHPKINLNL